MTMTSRGPAELESSDPELDAPEPIPTATFEQLGVAPELVAVLHSQGITAPFPVQALTIPDGIAGRDVLRQGEDRVGQDPRLRTASAHAGRHRRPRHPARPGARAHT